MRRGSLESEVASLRHNVPLAHTGESRLHRGRPRRDQVGRRESPENPTLGTSQAARPQVAAELGPRSSVTHPNRRPSLERAWSTGLMELPPHPEVPAALARLRESSMTVVALVNSSEEVGRRQLVYAGISCLTDRLTQGKCRPVGPLPGDDPQVCVGEGASGSIWADEGETDNLASALFDGFNSFEVVEVGLGRPG